MNPSAPNPPLRPYSDLADWYPLLTPVSDYAEEAAFYLRLFRTHCKQAPRSLLDLGCGGGHNAAYLKQSLACTLVDNTRGSWQSRRHGFSAHRSGRGRDVPVGLRLGYLPARHRDGSKPREVFSGFQKIRSHD